jgi:4-amino-4-deoxy-L-arabinose transferase-like glycosyltransferase
METTAGVSALSSDQRTPRWPVWVLAALLTLYIFGGLPASSTLLKYHLDEAYYTDAALQMRTSGDYLTPRWDDGRPRFHKPVYTYWLVAAGFAATGPGLLAARAPFLLLSALIVWLTFVLARRVHGCAETALLAAVFVLSNLLFMDATGHALPDTLLLAGITLSQFGLVNLVLLGRRSWPEYLCAYGGMGLAIGSKGLSGLLPLLYAVIYMVWTRRRAGEKALSFRILWHGPAIAAGLCIGLWWFVAEYARFGGEFLDGFLGDQFVRKLENSHWSINLPTYTLFTFGSFLPWVVLLLPRLRRGGAGWRPLTGPGRACIGYAVGFAVLVILTYMPGNITYERYMLPAIPLLAVALAGLLAPATDGAADGTPSARWFSGAFHVVIISALVLAAVLLLFARGPELRQLVSGCWLVVTGGVVLWLLRRGRPTLTPVALGVFLMLLTFVYENHLRPTYRSSPAPAILSELQTRGANNVQLVTWTKGLDSQLRAISGGTLQVSECLAGDAIANPGGRFVVLPQTFKEDFDTQGFALTRVAWRYERVNLRKLLAALFRGEAGAYLEEHREYYWLAERRDAKAVH